MRYFPALIVGILSFSLNLSCTRKSLSDAEDKDEEEPEVLVIQLEKQELFDHITFSGTLAARSQETLYAPLAGTVKELNVHDGSKVLKGSKLLVIRPDSEGLEYKNHLVKAFRKGTVLGLLAKTGTHVDRNQELLTLADLSAFKTEISATVDDIHFLKKGQEVEIEVSLSQKVKGLVKTVPRTPDPKTKTFAIDIEIPCPKEDTCQHIYPGLLGTVVVKKNPHMGYRLPFKYLRRQKSHILVVNEDNTVSFTEVEVGQHYGQDVEILKGITAQTKIVTSFSSMPSEGQKVKIARPEEASEQKDT